MKIKNQEIWACSIRVWITSFSLTPVDHSSLVFHVSPVKVQRVSCKLLLLFFAAFLVVRNFQVEAVKYSPALIIASLFQIIHTFYVGRDESVETIAFSSS